jgi:hypothetical protein
MVTVPEYHQALKIKVYAAKKFLWRSLAILLPQKFKRLTGFLDEVLDLV